MRNWIKGAQLQEGWGRLDAGPLLVRVQHSPQLLLLVMTA